MNVYQPDYFGPDWYASPAGSGDGSETAPMSLNTAFANDVMQPGQTLYLSSGVYQGDFTTGLDGVSGRPITIQPHQNEKPQINGAFVLDGSYCVLKDLELYWDGWTGRLSELSDGTDLVRKTINGSGTYLKLINCIIHDFSVPFFSSAMAGLEFYGCIIFHNGYSGPDRGHGHGLYIQNDTPVMVVKDCIVFDNFGWGIHAYTENDTINNVHLEGNTSFRNGSPHGAAYNNILIGGLVVAQNPTLIANMTYDAQENLGYSAQGGFTGAVIEDNYFPGGLAKIGDTKTITSESGNYYGPAIGNQVFVRPNTYQTDRANVTIYNEAGADSVTVDLSAVTGLAAGDSVTVRNVQDYFVDIQTLTLDASKQITVDMQAANRTVAAPVAWTAPPTTFPTFGAFVVEKA